MKDWNGDGLREAEGRSLRRKRIEREPKRRGALRRILRRRVKGSCKCLRRVSQGVLGRTPAKGPLEKMSDISLILWCYWYDIRNALRLHADTSVGCWHVGGISRVSRRANCGQTNRQTDRQTDRQTNRQTDKQTNRQTDRPIDRQTDRRTDGQRDGQTERERGKRGREY